MITVNKITISCQIDLENKQVVERFRKQLERFFEESKVYFNYEEKPEKNLTIKTKEQ